MRAWGIGLGELRVERVKVSDRPGGGGGMMVVGTSRTPAPCFVARTWAGSAGATVLVFRRKGGTHVFGLLRREAWYVRIEVWHSTVVGMR